MVSSPDIVDLTNTQSQFDSDSLTSDPDSTASIPTKFQLNQSIRRTCQYLSEGFAQLPSSPTVRPSGAQDPMPHPTPSDAAVIPSAQPGEVATPKDPTSRKSTPVGQCIITATPPLSPSKCLEQGSQS